MWGVGFSFILWTVALYRFGVRSHNWELLKVPQVDPWGLHAILQDLWFLSPDLSPQRLYQIVLSVCTKHHLIASSLLSKLSSIFPLQTMLFSRYSVSVLHTSELQPVDDLSAAWLWCLLWGSHDALAYKNSVHKRLQMSTVTFSCIVIPLKTAFL